MCEDCATSGLDETDRKVALLSWMKRRLQEEKDLLCSCCGVVHESRFYSSYTVLQTEPSDVLECAQKDRSIKEETDGEKDGAVVPEKAEFEREIPSAPTEGIEEHKEGREKEGDSKGETLLPSRCDVVEDALAAILALPLEKIADEERIFSIELIDSSTMTRCPLRGQDADGILLERDAIEQESATIDIREIAEKQPFTVSSDDTEERHANPTLTDEPSEDVSFDGRNIIPQEDIHVVSVSVIKAEEVGEQHGE